MFCVLCWLLVICVEFVVLVGLLAVVLFSFEVLELVAFVFCIRWWLVFVASVWGLGL